MTVANPRVTDRSITMIRIRTLRRLILQIASLVAGMLLWATPIMIGAVAQTAAAQPSGTPTTEGEFPYHVIAEGHGAKGTAGAELVWLVQHGIASGDQRPDVNIYLPGFVIAQRGVLSLFDRSGTRVTELDPGQATFLTSDGYGSLGSASGDLVLFVQIALVPAAGVPANLPPGIHASDSFPAPAGDALDLELIRGILNPGREGELSLTELPSLLLAADTALQIEMPTGTIVNVSADEAVLLQGRVTIRNLGQQPATFVVARQAPPESVTAQSVARPNTNSTNLPLPALDPALDDAWHRNGCHLNPGNPSCITVAVAAECTINPTAPACIADSDGDRCSDIAEIQAGLGPFDATDCVANAAGQPAVNCLFPMENLACNGQRSAGPEEPECAAERDIRLRRNPGNFAGCDGTADPSSDECLLNARDPACDGFAPGGF